MEGELVVELSFGEMKIADLEIQLETDSKVQLSLKTTVAGSKAQLDCSKASLDGAKTRPEVVGAGTDPQLGRS